MVTLEVVAVKDAEIAIEAARGQAEAQRLISSTLTERFLQYQSIMAQRELSSARSSTVVYIPLGVSGVPPS